MTIAFESEEFYKSEDVYKRKAGPQLWGYLKSQDAASGCEFSLLTNGKNSCKRRRYDAVSGVRINPNCPSMSGYYTDIHSDLIATWTELATPPAVPVKDIETGLPYSLLSQLQRSAKVSVTKERHCAVSAPGKTGMFSGLDSLINEAFGLGDFDYTSKSAALLLSDLTPRFHGSKLIQSLYDRALRNLGRLPGQIERDLAMEGNY